MPNQVSKASVKPYIEKYEACADDVVGVDRLWLLDLLKEVSFHRFQDMYRRQKRNGVKDPVYRDGDIPDLRGKGDCWK